MTPCSLPAVCGFNQPHSSTILVVPPSPRLLSAPHINACLDRQPSPTRSRAHVEQQVSEPLKPLPPFATLTRADLCNGL